MSLAMLPSASSASSSPRRRARRSNCWRREDFIGGETERSEGEDCGAGGACASAQRPAASVLSRRYLTYGFDQMVMIARSPHRAHTEWYEPCAAGARGRHLDEPLRPV